MKYKSKRWISRGQSSRARAKDWTKTWTKYFLNRGNRSGFLVYIDNSLTSLQGENNEDTNYGRKKGDDYANRY